LAFWTGITLLASAFPVHTTRGTIVSVSIAPILAATALGGPAAGAIVAVLGSTESRELRGETPWYGALYNHAAVAIPAVAAGLIYVSIAGPGSAPSSLNSLVGLLIGGLAYFAINESLAAAAISIRQHHSFGATVIADLRAFGLAFVGLAPLAWLMALAYSHVGWAVVLLFALPLYTTRASYASVVEIRKMFTQTVRALASAIDARDPTTRKHSEHVSGIAVEIGQVMGLGESELEQLEWGGLLHDIGKIGVRDNVLLKPGRLTRDEREAMNSHPQRGREILKPVEKLGPELPLILHHHQWFNGSGYPRVDERGEPVSRNDPGYEQARPLFGEEIPFLARILHVADAFEAMTASRPYRPNPLSPEQATDELRKYSGIQFDPRIVAAFEKTKASIGDDEFLRPEPAVAQIPQIGEIARQRKKGAISTTTQVDTHS
jgi:HD-GYP domain-containing protein (c-di-GMP phosphodiesterase class II)